MSGRTNRGGHVRPAAFREEERISVEPRYAITAVAARVGVHEATVRRYEAFGLIEARAIEAGTRLFSEADVDRARRARRLVDDLGVNLAGAAAILHLRDQLLDLQRELHRLRDRT
jgi:MerR family transcriptional regulator/heat shock protein HspR